jgi:hypothetical protein
MGIGAGTAAVISAGAAALGASAIRDQNLATSQAQQQAFNQRLAASSAQTDAQTAAMQQTMADRQTATAQMRTAQSSAQQQQQSVLDAENQQADALRARGDAAAQQLLHQTNQPTLAADQTNAQDQGALLLGQVAPSGPQPSDPRGTGDPATTAAVSRRLAEAATNVRTYGSKVAAVNAYSQPTFDVNQAISENKTGIMPATTAESLLRAGSATRLLPSQIAYRNAGDLGAAMDELIRSRGQGALDTASLSYGNATNIANLGQSDATTLAANKAAQIKQDALAQQSLGGIISGVGQLGLYGAGYLGGNPLKSTPTTPATPK